MFRELKRKEYLPEGQVAKASALRKSFKCCWWYLVVEGTPTNGPA
jgi:hypothetical protein